MILRAIDITCRLIVLSSGVSSESGAKPVPTAAGLMDRPPGMLKLLDMLQNVDRLMNMMDEFCVVENQDA